MKLHKLLCLVLALCLVLCACGKKDEPEATPEEKEEEISYDIVNPLTGEVLEEDISENRPFAFVINNLKAATPQCGISKADIIYEVPVEGGITRMVAIFQDISDAGAIGSIRSARPYLIDIALAYDSVFIHAGGSDQAYTDLKNKGVLNFDGVNGWRGTDIFYRDAERRQTAGYEHSLFTSSNLIEEIIYPMDDIRLTHEDGYKFDQTYETDLDLQGEAANSIIAQITSSKSTSFEYDAESQTYKIFEYDKEYTDGNTDQQVSAKNVIFISTDISRVSGDSAGRLSVRTTGEGTGYFAYNGEIIPIKWSRDSYSEQFEYFTQDGSPLALGRGNTYVCVMYSDDDVSYSAE